MDRVDGLLRKKDLVDQIGVAKSTIADWVIEFSVYIPTVKNGAVTYYRPEALDVLRTIRELRELDYSKVQIMEMLAKRGFPITVEEAVQDVERVLSGSDPRDTLLTVMQTMGQAVVEIGKQTERQNRMETRIEEHSERIDGQDGRIKTVEQKQDEQDGRVADLQQTVEDLRQQLGDLDEIKRQLAEAQQQIAAANEPKSFFRRLFGR